MKLGEHGNEKRRARATTRVALEMAWQDAGTLLKNSG